MLEGVAIVADIVIVVVRIGEEVVARGKDIARRQVGGGQVSLLRVFDDKVVFRLVGEVLA